MKAPSCITLRKWLILLLFSAATITLSAQINPAPSKWESEIRTFERNDISNAPPKNAILFLGSSTIRKWTNLQQDFPGLKVINRGFGGSQIADSTALAERVVFPYQPKTIVFYAGDNDLAAGKSADQVVADYVAFVKKVHDMLPQTDIDFISIKPCPARWKFKDKVKSVNEQIQKMSGDHLKFINIYPLMLNEDGTPRKDLFLADGLHPNEKCYRMWVPVIRPHLE